MPILSAFADEISPDLNEQVDVLTACGIRYLDLRAVDGQNVMTLTDKQLDEIKHILDDHGIGVAAIGSPIGKTTIDNPPAVELDRVKRAADMAERLGTKYIRVFSFYAPEGKSITDFAGEVFDRMAGWVEWIESEKRPVVLTHENERAIYGDIPERCEQIMQKLYGPHMVTCFDPANFVYIGLEGVFDNCWPPLKKYTGYFHLKDCKPGQNIVPCGDGDSDVQKVLADAHKDGFDGFMTLEPHLKKASQFAGYSGPDLFKLATDKVKQLCDEANIPLS